MVSGLKTKKNYMNTQVKIKPPKEFTFKILSGERQKGIGFDAMGNPYNYDIAEREYAEIIYNGVVYILFSPDGFIWGKNLYVKTGGVAFGGKLKTAQSVFAVIKKHISGNLPLDCGEIYNVIKAAYPTHDKKNAMSGSMYLFVNGKHVRISNHAPNNFKNGDSDIYLNEGCTKNEILKAIK